jgi:hypothetical protein
VSGVNLRSVVENHEVVVDHKVTIGDSRLVGAKSNVTCHSLLVLPQLQLVAGFSREWSYG